LPVIRLHDLRHTPRHPVAGRRRAGEGRLGAPGHASATITLTVYRHMHPGMGRHAADRFAALLDG
jgi:hypothetical protein